MPDTKQNNCQQVKIYTFRCTYVYKEEETDSVTTSLSLPFNELFYSI